MYYLNKLILRISMRKKCLMTVMAAVALGGMFSGCGNDIDLSGGNSAEFDIVQNYENAFITRFGQPHENQTWGFGPASSGTRSVVESPSISANGYYSYNAEMALAWKGVDAAIASGTAESTFSFMNAYSPWRDSGWEDKFYQINASIIPSELSDADREKLTNAILNVIPESGNNLGKAQATGYSITTKGGPVTITPVYHHSSSNDKISYYYYPAGSVPSAEDIKKMDKYVIGEMGNGLTNVNKNTYSLVYKDANGNVSYDFPANYVINFIVNNTDNNGTRDIYKSGGITTMTGGTEASLTSEGFFKVSTDDYYQCGNDRYINGKVQIKFGNTLGVPQFTAAKEGSSFTFEDNAFSFYMEGNGVNGSLDGGCTCYYLRPEANGTINVGVKLNSGKKFYIKDLGNIQDPSYVSSGTSLTGYDGKTETSDYTGVYSFPVEAWHMYAIYAEGSKLGFYGFEFVDSDGNKERDGVFTSALGPFDCGFGIKLGSVNVKLGKVPAYFSKPKSSGLGDYTAYTAGTGMDGGLSGMATTYYFLAWNPGVIRVAVSLNANKNFYIKDLGENGWNNTSGTSLSGYDGITVSSKYNGTYDFPVEANHVYAVYAEGSKLGFYGCEFLTGTPATEGTPSMSLLEKKTINNQPEFYSNGNLNQEIHQDYTWGLPDAYGYGITDITTSHTAVYAINDVEGYTNLVGFEDWKDFDFNDVVFAVKGTTGGQEIEVPEPKEEEDEDPGTFICRIIAEDLTVGENSDFDFNDVVFDVYCDGSTTTIRLRAAGGELPLYIDGHEVHAEFGYTSSYPLINTGWDGKAIDYENRYVDFTIGGVYNSREAANNIPVTVTKRGKNQVLENILLTARTGKVASKVCVGQDYEWCSERQDIDKKFRRGDDKLFSGYVVGTYGDDWYQLKGQ